MNCREVTYAILCTLWPQHFNAIHNMWERMSLQYVPIWEIQKEDVITIHRTREERLLRCASLCAMQNLPKKLLERKHKAISISTWALYSILCTYQLVCNRLLRGYHIHRYAIDMCIHSHQPHHIKLYDLSTFAIYRIS